MDVHGAFIETFGRDLGYRLVTRGELETRGLAEVSLKRPLRLVDLTGFGLAALGADARLCTGDYSVAQAWSVAFWSHPAQPDGLLWRSRFDPDRLCAAVFDRAERALAVTSLGSLAHPRHAERLAAILDTYKFGFLDTL